MGDTIQADYAPTGSVKLLFAEPKQTRSENRCRISRSIFSNLDGRADITGRE